MTWSRQTAPANRTRITRFAAAMLAAATGIAVGQALYPSRAEQIYGADAKLKPQLAPSRKDRARFNRSGTRGRQGLGASPLHPEGPGNTTR
jgi:hypothetical protein